MKTVLIIVNILTGLFVGISSILGFLMSGIAETPEPTNNYFYLILLLIWVIGVALQFKPKTRVIGFIISFIPVAYYMYLYIMAAV